MIICIRALILCVSIVYPGSSSPESWVKVFHIIFHQQTFIWILGIESGICCKPSLSNATELWVVPPPPPPDLLIVTHILKIIFLSKSETDGPVPINRAVKKR